MDETNTANFKSNYDFVIQYSGVMNHNICIEMRIILWGSFPVVGKISVYPYILGKNITSRPGLTFSVCQTKITLSLDC